MICKKCQKAAKKNRKRIDKAVAAGEPWISVPHPNNCGCPCLHKAGPWEKLFSVERPNG